MEECPYGGDQTNLASLKGDIHANNNSFSKVNY
jgi:hypothetical protein